MAPLNLFTKIIDSIFFKTTLLAVLYFVFGKMGLYLASPPGYATIIWPPSGIALGMLTCYGARLWPGVLIGSFILNSHVSGAYSGGHIDYNSLLTGFCIAIGSTIQTLFGRFLIHRFFGEKIKLNHFIDIIKLALLIGPLTCLVAASMGVATLYLNSIIPSEKFIENWLAWWTGDIFGIFILFPFVLLSSKSKESITWQSRNLNGTPIFALIIIIIPIVVMLIGWKTISEKNFKSGQLAFSALKIESEFALNSRIKIYDNAIIGGIGLFEASNSVSRNEWKDYSNIIEIEKNFPGMNGLGWIKLVKNNYLENYLVSFKKENNVELKVHPTLKDGPYYIISYIEPESANSKAVGLNIAFEKGRKETAERSIESGKSTITPPVFLVQDDKKTPGFLLLHPYYKKEGKRYTPEERKENIQGWIYAPMVANKFLDKLIPEQGEIFDLTIYDGEEKDVNLIYTSVLEGVRGKFSAKKTLNIMGRDWVILWNSKPQFDSRYLTNEPALILIGGTIVTLSLFIFILISTIKRKETMEALVNEREYALPLIVFIIIFSGTLTIFGALKKEENLKLVSLINERAVFLKDLIATSIEANTKALHRVSLRWEAANGTPLEQWKNDTANYIQDIKGIKNILWADLHFKVGRSEPELRNENLLINLGLSDPQLSHQIDRVHPSIFFPSVKNEKAGSFFIFFPINIDGKVQGFTVAVFDSNKYFGDIINKVNLNQNIISIASNNNIIFSNKHDATISATSNEYDASYKSVALVPVHDHKWEVSFIPSNFFLSKNSSDVPYIVLFSGFIISLLSGFSTRSILSSRLRALYVETSIEFLKDSQNHLQTVFDTVSNGVLTIDSDGIIQSFNSSTQKIFGLDNESLIGKSIFSLINIDQSFFKDTFNDPNHHLGINAKEKDRKPTYGIFGQHKNGALIALDIDFGKMQFRDSKQLIVVTLQDISDRKAQQDFQNLIFSTIPDFIFVKDQAFNIVQANNAFLSLYPENERDKIIGTTTLEKYTLEESSEFLKRDKEAFYSGSCIYEEEITFPDGKVRTLHTNKVRFYNNIGAPYILGVSKDISQLKQAENDKIILINKLISSNTELERFAYVASHDMQEPLRMINNFSEIIQVDYGEKLDDAGKEYINIIKSSGERMLAMIDDLLEYARLEHSPNITEKIDLNNIISMVVQNITLLISERGAKVVYGDLPIINGNPIQVMRLIQNLVSNGIKYQKPGGNPLIEIQAEDNGDELLISIKDNGLGIKEDFLEKIFQPFRRLQSWNNEKGSGIGLAVCRKIVENHNGKIWVESSLGLGSCFFFTISKNSNKD